MLLSFRRHLILFISVILLAGFHPSWAVNTAETNAQVVYLRVDCGTQTPNCFDNMTDLLNWTWNTRNPNAVNPLLIDVGPGTFHDFYCENKGWVTVRGSGRNNTKIDWNSRPANSGRALFLSGCTEMAFQSLSIGGVGDGVYWVGAGRSSWSDVSISGVNYAWYGAPYGGRGLHYWFNSVLKVDNSSCSLRCAAFFDYEGESWFFGGEITYVAHSDEDTRAAAVFLSNAANRSSELQLFGTVIRAKAAQNATLTKLTAVRADTGQTFHSHGGVISVNASMAGSANVNVFAIENGIEVDENGLVVPNGPHAVIHIHLILLLP